MKVKQKDSIMKKESLPRRNSKQSKLSVYISNNHKSTCSGFIKCPMMGHQKVAKRSLDKNI